MSVQFLLFVNAILLVAVFWELCKIRSHFKKTFPTPAPASEGGHANEAVTAKALD
jgi:hypothetical protein